MPQWPSLAISCYYFFTSHPSHFLYFCVFYENGIIPLDPPHLCTSLVAEEGFPFLLWWPVWKQHNISASRSGVSSVCNYRVGFLLLYWSFLRLPGLFRMWQRSFPCSLSFTVRGPGPGGNALVGGESGFSVLSPNLRDKEAMDKPFNAQASVFSSVNWKDLPQSSLKFLSVLTFLTFSQKQASFFFCWSYWQVVAKHQKSANMLLANIISHLFAASWWEILSGNNSVCWCLLWAKGENTGRGNSGEGRSLQRGQVWCCFAMTVNWYRETNGRLVSVPGRWVLHKCNFTFCVNLCWGNCRPSIFSVLLAMLHGLLTVVQ